MNKSQKILQGESKRVLMIGLVWPEPGSSASGARILHLIQLFHARGWDVTFASAAADSEFMFDLVSLDVARVQIELNSATFDTFIHRLQPTIVLFDRFVSEEQFGWRVLEQCPQAIRIIDTQDLHFLRQARQAALRADRECSSQDLCSDLAKREIASVLRSDLSLIISEVEVALLQGQFGIDSSLLHYLPLLAEPISVARQRSWPVFEARRNFVFIGNFVHDPNWDCVQYLKSKVWPRIRKSLPEAEVHIYGAYSSQKIWELNKPAEGFCVKGRVDEAQAVVEQARVCLAPMRFGAGQKGKLLEAMLCGTPSITTNIGAEGMCGNLPWPGIIANDPATLASAAIELYSDQNLWLAAQAKAVDLVEQRFSRSLFEEDLISHILSIQENLDAHRLNNFLGAMLMHHSMASTKYLSRWIEEKNSIGKKALH